MADHQSAKDNLAEDHLIGDKDYVTSDATKATLQSVFADYAAYFPDWTHSTKKTSVYRTQGPFLQRIRLRDVPHAKSYTIIMSIACMVGPPQPMVFQTVPVHTKRFRYNYNLDIPYLQHSAERCAVEIAKIKTYFKPDISEPLTPQAILRRLRYRQFFIAQPTMTIKIGKAILLAEKGKYRSALSFMKTALKAEKTRLRKHIKTFFGDAPAGIKVWSREQPTFKAAEDLIAALETDQYDAFIKAEMKAYKRKRL